MSVTESDIECSMDSDSDVTEPKARSRPSSSQSIRSEAMMYDFEVRLCCLSFFFFYYSALFETPIQFSAFSAQEARYRVKILTGCQGSKG